MNFWEKLGFKKRSFTEAYAPFVQPYLMAENAGQYVNGITAMNVPPYASAINLMSTSLAKLSLHVEKDGKRVEKHPIADLLENPSELYDSYTLFQQAEMHRLNEGNAYILIERDSDGNAKQLLLINPSLVNVIIQGSGYIYQVTPTNGKTMNVQPKNMIHVKSPMLDMNAFKGIGYHKLLERQLGLFLAAQSHQNNYFALGSNPISIVEVDEKLSPEKREKVREAWEQMSQGNKQHRVGIVDAGMKYKSLGFNFQELEMNTLFDNVTKQIASVFNIAPFMLGHEGTGNTYSNIETESMRFLQQALMPSIVAWERQLMKLFVKGDGYTAKFNYETLLRADSKSRAERLKMLVEAEIMNKEEARSYEGLTND